MEAITELSLVLASLFMDDSEFYQKSIILILYGVILSTLILGVTIALSRSLKRKMMPSFDKNSGRIIYPYLSMWVARHLPIPPIIKVIWPNVLSVPDRVLAKKVPKTVTDLIVNSKHKTYGAVELALLIAAILNQLLAYFFEVYSANSVSLILIILYLGIHFDQWLLIFRIKNNWYGRNEYEAKEIIQFIISNADKDDSTGSGGLKAFLPNSEASIEGESVSGLRGAIR